MTEAPAVDRGAAAEALADFIRGIRVGIEEGLDPLGAVERAGSTLPDNLAAAVESLQGQVGSGAAHR